MHTRQVGRIAEVLQKYLGPEAAQEIAEALGADTQEIDHYGPVKIRRNLPYKDRGYSPDWNPDTMLRPVPPVKPPVVTDACLELDNQPVDKSDRAGENGFAVDIRSGIHRNLGESWLLKHAKVVSVSAVEDGDPDTLPDALDSTYVYADCLECGDSKGRGLSQMPVRIFCDNCGSLPNPGQIIRYLRDTNGLAWTWPCTAVASSFLSDPSSSSSSSHSSVPSSGPSSSSSNPSDSSSGPSDPSVSSGSGGSSGSDPSVSSDSGGSGGSSGSGASGGSSVSGGSGGSSSSVAAICQEEVTVQIAGVDDQALISGSSAGCAVCAAQFNGTFVAVIGATVCDERCIWRALPVGDDSCLNGSILGGCEINVQWDNVLNKLIVTIVGNIDSVSEILAKFEVAITDACPPSAGTYNPAFVEQDLLLWDCDASGATVTVTIA